MNCSMLQEDAVNISQGLLDALMKLWSKDKYQVIETLNLLELTYKSRVNEDIIFIEHNEMNFSDILIESWDGTISFIDWCVNNNIEHYIGNLKSRVFSNEKKNYIEYIISSKSMLYSLLRDYPSDIDKILNWNNKPSVNDFTLNEKIKLWVEDTPLKERTDLDAATKPARKVAGYCPKPFFDYIVCYDEAHMCCSGWHAAKSIGNPSEQSLKDIWNSEQAKLFRQSIIDGSYRYCLHDSCFFLTDKDYQFPELEAYSETIQADIRRGDGAVSHGPAFLNCGFDMSCNLSCPSCRNEAVIEFGERAEKIQQIETKVEQMGSFFHSMYISGSGDPFGSPHSKKFLKRMNRETFPNLKDIVLHSNGQLFTQRNWLQLPQFVRDCTICVEISLDGASKETIEHHRRGVNFKKLYENLKFIANLRKEFAICSLKFSFVVQDNNFHEMSNFVAFCSELNADSIVFTKIVNWGTFTEQQYLHKAVHLPGHPRHQELLQILQAANLQNENVDLGNLSPLVTIPDTYI